VVIHSRNNFKRDTPGKTRQGRDVNEYMEKLNLVEGFQFARVTCSTPLLHSEYLDSCWGKALEGLHKVYAEKEGKRRLWRGKKTSKGVLKKRYDLGLRRRAR